MKTIVNRVFYVDVSHIPGEEVANYIESVQKSWESPPNPVIESFRAAGVWEDLYIPVRGAPSRVEILTVELKDQP